MNMKPQPLPVPEVRLATAEEAQELMTLLAMRRDPSPFESRLASAWLAATEAQAQALRAAFPELLQRYSAGAEALEREYRTQYALEQRAAVSCRMASLRGEPLDNPYLPGSAQHTGWERERLHIEAATA